MREQSLGFSAQFQKAEGSGAVIAQRPNGAELEGCNSHRRFSVTS